MTENKYSFKAVIAHAAKREGVSCSALVRSCSNSTARASNTADSLFSSCPAGAMAAHHCGVATLEKGMAIPYGLRLALARCHGSESVITALKEYA
jgi:hypothetical protein